MTMGAHTSAAGAAFRLGFASAGAAFRLGFASAGAAFRLGFAKASATFGTIARVTLCASLRVG